MKRIQDKADEGTSYRQQAVLDHLDMLPAAEIFNPYVRHGRERPIGALGHQQLKASRTFLIRGIHRNSEV